MEREKVTISKNEREGGGQGFGGLREGPFEERDAAVGLIIRFPGLRMES